MSDVFTVFGKCVTRTNHYLLHAILVILLAKNAMETQVFAKGVQS